jgi:signal transduction histidine kinase
VIARRDIVIAAAFTVAMAVGLALTKKLDGPYLANVACYCPAAAVLVLRRRDPLLTTVLCMTLVFVGTRWLTDVEDLAFLSLLFLVLPCYALGHDADDRQAWIGIVFAVAALMAISAVSHDTTLNGTLFPAGIQVASFACGRLLRNRMLMSRALADEAARLELDREARAQAAVGEERTRIAREMHDVVAHTMAIMVVQAGAARRVLDRDPEAAERSLVTVEETGRMALTELRRLLGFLREDAPPEFAPQPALGDLEGLLDRARAAGLPVEMISDGTPFELDSGVELAVYRTVQEALTNTLKHAGPGAQASVTLRWHDDSLEVAVLDTGGGGSDIEGSGQGLTGMRERIAMVGGEVNARPRPDGGFAVRATIPRVSEVAVL